MSEKFNLIIVNDNQPGDPVTHELEKDVISQPNHLREFLMKKADFNKNSVRITLSKRVLEGLPDESYQLNSVDTKYQDLPISKMSVLEDYQNGIVAQITASKPSNGDEDNPSDFFDAETVNKKTEEVKYWHGPAACFLMSLGADEEHLVIKLGLTPNQAKAFGRKEEPAIFTQKDETGQDIEFEAYGLTAFLQDKSGKITPQPLNFTLADQTYISSKGNYLWINDSVQAEWGKTLEDIQKKADGTGIGAEIAQEFLKGDNIRKAKIGEFKYYRFMTTITKADLSIKGEKSFLNQMRKRKIDFDTVAKGDFSNLQKFVDYCQSAVNKKPNTITLLIGLKQSGDYINQTFVIDNQCKLMYRTTDDNEVNGKTYTNLASFANKDLEAGQYSTLAKLVTYNIGEFSEVKQSEFAKSGGVEIETEGSTGTSDLDDMF